MELYLNCRACSFVAATDGRCTDVLRRRVHDALVAQRVLLATVAAPAAGQGWRRGRRGGGGGGGSGGQREGNQQEEEALG